MQETIHDANAYERLKRLGLVLPTPLARGGLYAPVKQSGNLIFVSGQGPVIDGIVVFAGKVGSERSVEEGQQAARICVLNTLAWVHEWLGDLARVSSVVKLLGFVASARGSTDSRKLSTVRRNC